MRRTTLITLLLFLSHFILKAQQSSFWSLNFVDPYLYNPAYAGFDRSLSANFHLINQWNDIEKGVQGQLVNAHLPLYILNGGVGFQVSRDVSGPLTVLNGGASYNYVFQSGLGLFSLGGRIGVQQIGINGKIILTPDGNYNGGAIDHQDDHLPVNQATGLAPKLDLGGYWKSGNLEVGVGVDNIHSPEVRLSDDNFKFQTARLFQLLARYEYELNDILSIDGYGVLMTDEKEIQTQIGAQMSYRDNIYFGMAFRGYSGESRDALIFSFGISINKHFTLFYAYDYVVSRLKSVTKNNTHGFTLNYNLNELIRTGLPPKVIYNPRF